MYVLISNTLCTSFYLTIYGSSYPYAILTYMLIVSIHDMLLYFMHIWNNAEWSVTV